MNAVARKDSHARNLKLKKEKRELMEKLKFLKQVDYILKKSELDQNSASDSDWATRWKNAEPISQSSNFLDA